MMERNFYSDDFEQLIREKTEQYKMYPSEKVWKGVHSSLHTRKRWFIAGMSLLVTGIILLAGKELILPSAHTGSFKKQALTASLATPKTTPENTALPVPFTEFRGGNHSASGHIVQGSGPLAEMPLTQDEINTSGIDDPSSGQQPDPTATIGQHIDLTSAPSYLAGAPVTTAKASSLKMDASGTTGTHVGNRLSGVSTTRTKSADAYTSYLSRVRTGNGLMVAEDPYETQQVIMTTAFYSGNIPAPGLQIPLHPASANRSMSRLRAAELTQPISADDEDDQAETPNEDGTPDNGAPKTSQQKINWLQDYAVYSLHPSPRKNKAYWQFYLAPTANVRALSGGTPANLKSDMAMQDPQPSPANTQAHSPLIPNIGFETGGSVIYKLSHILSVKAGLQFNYSNFAFNNPPYTTPGAAPTALNGSYSGVPDSASGPAGGQASQVLHKAYYQLSVPVGLELKVWGNDRLQVNIAATVQPTYLMNSNDYLLTIESDNIAKAPPIFRKWNINGGAEAYISYKIGGLRLQIGPEFRYQFLSSYSDQYPVRENLKQYGLKIGFTKAIR